MSNRLISGDPFVIPGTLLSFVSFLMGEHRNPLGTMASDTGVTERDALISTSLL
jgi:hypothetical protein